MAAKRKKKRSPPKCVVCRVEPRFNGELCDPCDTSYEEWLTEGKGSSLKWAAQRARDMALSEASAAIAKIP